MIGTLLIALTHGCYHHKTVKLKQYQRQDNQLDELIESYGSVTTKEDRFILIVQKNRIT